MAQKAKRENKKRTKDNSKLVAIIAAAAAAVMIIAVIVAVVMSNGSGLNEDYFVNDETKYVLTIEGEELGVGVNGEEEYVPIRAHVVYDYEGEDITAMRVYYAYDSSADAKAAYNFIMEDETNLEGFEDAKVDGKYVVLTAPAYNYEGMTVDDVRAQIEFMEMLQEVDEEDTEDAESEGTAETAETAEE